jgi:hypothetical protein
MRKIYVDVKVRLIMNLEEEVSVDDAISEMDYVFNLENEHGEMVDTEIMDYNVEDSK